MAFAFLALLQSITVRPGRKDYSIARSQPKPLFHAPAANVFAELRTEEASELHKFLYTQSKLNLTDRPEGYGEENYVAAVEVLRPNKSEAAAFLDGAGPVPARFARVSVVESQADEASICEYKVGPLPPNVDTQVLPLRYPHAAGRHCIQTPIADVMSFYIWALSIGYDVADITDDLLGAKTNLLDPFNPDTLYIGARPALIEGGRMIHWLEFFRNGPRSDARSLLPQGLYAKLNVSSPDPELWSTSEWFYNGIMYPNLSTFRKAWESGNLTKSSLNLDGLWTDTEDFASMPAGRSKAPPLSIQPYGPRYQLDHEQSYVSWMGFSFYIATSASRALSLHDIRFNNTRIIYELGLQEALAHYAGSEPLQSGLEFLDTFFGMGNMQLELVPGHDCPAYASYLDMTYHKNGQTITNKNAICIFEYTSDAPLQRHTSAFAVTVSRNAYLVVRSVSTVGNYDYTIDYLFFLDGSIEVKVRASGYIFGAYTNEDGSATNPADGAVTDKDELRSRSQTNTNRDYGYKMHTSASTSMHDHVLLFRADIDLPKHHANTFETVSVEPITEHYYWDVPESPTRNTMHLVKSKLDKEAGIDWPRNSKALYLIQSNETNAWGEKRSYRIQPGTGMGTPSHLTIINSTALGKSALWADHDLWIVKEHDNEPLGAHEKNYFDPKEPLVDFSRIADGEPLNEGGEGDDLVVYFNLGGHHVPHSGDIPNTLMHTSASSVILSPFNFFDHDISIHTRQGVRVDGRTNKEKNGWQKGSRWFGGRYGHDSTDQAEEKLVLDVRKDLEPDVEHLFEEDGEGRVAGNKVGGGLFGLYGSADEMQERIADVRRRKHQS